MTLEDNNEAEGEKAQQTETGTVEDADKDVQTASGAEPDPHEDGGKSTNDSSGERAEGDELAKWKAMSRKNEDRASANLKAFQSADAELRQARTEIARLQAKAKYPQITDSVLSDLCPATEPEAIAAWAEKYAQYNPLTGTAHAGKAQTTEDPLARKTAMQAEHPTGTSHPKNQPGDVYKRVMERQKARRRNK